MGARRCGISLPVLNLIYQAKREKRNSISTSSHVLFCLLYKHTNDNFLDNFPKIFKDNQRVPIKNR